MGSATVEEVLACLADVLELRPSDLDPDAPLTTLGLESFTAVRLRRRLLEESGLGFPLTAFLGSATARTVAAGIVPDEPAGDGESFPLTPIQTAYLVGRDPAFPLGGVATFYYFEYDRVPQGSQEADLDRLETAWNRLVRRHPMLRMVVGADARQTVLDQVPGYAITRTDLRGESPERAGQALESLRAECSHQVLPTDRWPLFDLRAALLPDGRTRLFVGVDVLALDLMSWMRLMREWGRYTADPGLELPAPPLGFADLVRRRLEDPAELRRREQASAYWARRAPGLPDGPGLPWTRGPAEFSGHRLVRHAAELPAEEWAQLRKQGAAHGLSPTGLLLAAFGLVLQRWGARDPFCLNTTLFDRDDLALGDDTPGLDSIVGDFTSTVLVEVPVADPGRWYGFAGYAAAVNRQFWTDLDHRAVSGMEALRAAIESGERPRVTDPATGLPLPTHTVVFTSGVGLAGPGEPPAAWLGTEVFGVSQTPQVMLDHIVWDEDGRLRIAWDAVDGALPAGFVDGMLAAHVRLLRRLATEPELWTDPALGWDPSFLADEDVAGGAFGGAGPLLDEPLRAAARRAPSAPALLDLTREVTARDLAGRALRTGRALAALGVGPGDLVAVVADKGIAQVTALLGVLASGAGYVPVEPSWPAGRVASLSEQASIRTALLAPEADDTAWPEHVGAHRLDADGVLRRADSAQPRRPAPDDLAYAIFTSGSTGRPKGVAVEHRAARTTLDDLDDRFPLGPDDRVLALSAYSFDLSVYDIFSVLGSGGAVVVPEAHRQRDPGHWLELMARHRVTVWNTAPALLEMLVEYAELEPEAVREALSTLRLVFLSADWIPVTLPDRLRALAPGAEVVSLGGATEASIWSICHPIGQVDPSWPSIPYGRALGGQSFHILDEHGRPCPVGEPGELHIGGDGLARGYVGDPGQTAERFITHPILRRRLYRTGDLGRWRYDGTIEFLGRLDRQVKIRGHRIELGEIEATLDRHPAVRQAVARAVPGPDERPRLVCYVVPADPAAPPSDDELAEALRASLPGFMVPNRFLLMDSLPITGNGKIDYKALASPYRPSGSPAEDEAPAPEAALHEQAPPTTAPEAKAISTTVTRGLRLSLTVSPDGVMELVVEGGTDGPLTHEIATTLAPATPLPSAATLPSVTPGADPQPAPHAEPPSPAPAASQAGPDPQVERAVARVFSELLKTPVDVSTPFFRLGASSLTMVLAHRALRAELDEELTVVDMFARPTVRELATFITTRKEASRDATPPPRQSPPPASGPASDQPASDQPASDQPASDQPAPDHAAARRAARARAAELAG
ncbi:amino acid adenylation domain-containing protein [Nonomuraea thailandensis]|uniref:Phenyloxazoline synthase MbtB n=1 Tax=Nonomuraea thailandensis TaxID=1188745 RepID=A0A9X2H0Y0_9ACTN|nr:amino acid adenylation domain-containing protein [Nonomuraea thailandensis]MCP2365371.1 amino acid adenylation domain-containing protein [Nonomuraea thailandensis]